MFNFKQLENLERILLLKAGVVPVDVHLHLDLHHEVHNKVQHCSVFSCTFNVQNIWFGRGSQSSRPIRDQITFHQWGERITIRCPDPLSELQISRGYSCSPWGHLKKFGSHTCLKLCNWDSLPPKQLFLGLLFGFKHFFHLVRPNLPPPMIYIVGKLWILALIWHRAIEIWRILLAVRILVTRPDCFVRMIWFLVLFVWIQDITLLQLLAELRSHFAKMK